MAELEQQVAEHNILQREIEAYGQQLRTLVGPVGTSRAGLVWIPLPPITIRLDILALKGELKGINAGAGAHGGAGARGRKGMGKGKKGVMLMGVSLYVGSCHTKPRFSLWLRQDAKCPSI